jgi:hypothetical protein
MEGYVMMPEFSERSFSRAIGLFARVDQTHIPSLRRYRIVAISAAPPLGLSLPQDPARRPRVQKLSQLLAAPSAALRNHLATSHPPLPGRLPRSAMQSPIPYQLRRKDCTC